MDASDFAVGAVLFQYDLQGKCHVIGYASHSLNDAKRNYCIWDQEFLGLIFGLTHWQHLLMGAKHKVKVFVDHANLAYYRHPQKVNHWIARYITTLTDYDIDLVHRAEKLNKANALSR